VDLSVVIPCKNEARHLPGMLDSLARQEWRGSWDVVIVDNGSTDDTRAIAEGYRNRLSMLLVDARDGRGAADARNRGVRHCNGVKLVFLDADDHVAEGYIAAMAAALDRAPVVCARAGFELLNAHWVRESWPNSWQQTEPLNIFRFLPFGGAGTLGVLRSIFEEVGGFDPSVPALEEADLCWRIQLAGHPAPVLVPDAVLEYRLPDRLSSMYQRGRDYARGRVALRELYGERVAFDRASLRDLVGSVRRIRCRRDAARTARILGSLVGERHDAGRSGGITARP
jgi:glycosyltransferase involved in cell wall biosynthesis